MQDFLVNEISIIVFLVAWRLFVAIRKRLKDEKLEEQKRIIKAISLILETNKKLESLRKLIKADHVVLAAIHNSGSILSPATPWYRRILQIQPFSEKYLNENPAQILDTHYFETLLKVQTNGDALISIDEIPSDSLLHRIMYNADAKYKYMYLMENGKDATYFIVVIFYFQKDSPNITQAFKDSLGTLKWVYTEQDSNTRILPKKK